MTAASVTVTVSVPGSQRKLFSVHLYSLGVSCSIRIEFCSIYDIYIFYIYFTDRVLLLTVFCFTLKSCLTLRSFSFPVVSADLLLNQTTSLTWEYTAQCGTAAAILFQLKRLKICFAFVFLPSYFLLSITLKGGSFQLNSFCK